MVFSSVRGVSGNAVKLGQENGHFRAVNVLSVQQKSFWNPQKHLVLKSLVKVVALQL